MSNKWGTLSKPERVKLLAVAGLPTGLSQLNWSGLQKSERKKLEKGKGWFEAKKPIMTDKGIEHKAPEHHRVAIKKEAGKALNTPMERKEPSVSKKISELPPEGTHITLRRFHYCPKTLARFDAYELIKDSGWKGWLETSHFSGCGGIELVESRDDNEEIVYDVKNKMVWVEGKPETKAHIINKSTSKTTQIKEPTIEKSNELLNREAFDFHYTRPNGHKDKVTLCAENDLSAAKLEFNKWNRANDATVYKIEPHQTTEDEQAGYKNHPKFNWMKTIEYPIEFPTFTLVFDGEDIPDKETYWDGHSWIGVGFIRDAYGVIVQEANLKDWIIDAKIHPMWGRGLYKNIMKEQEKGKPTPAEQVIEKLKNQDMNANQWGEQSKYDSYLNTLPNMERGRARKTLNTQLNYEGNVMTRREFVEKKASEGGKVVSRKERMYKKEEALKEKLGVMWKTVPFGNSEYPATKEYNRLKAELDAGLYKNILAIQTPDTEFVEVTKTEADYFNYLTKPGGGN